MPQIVGNCGTHKRTRSTPSRNSCIKLRNVKRYPKSWQSEGMSLSVSTAYSKVDSPGFNDFNPLVEFFKKIKAPLWFLCDWLVLWHVWLVGVPSGSISPYMWRCFAPIHNPSKTASAMLRWTLGEGHSLLSNSILANAKMRGDDVLKGACYTMSHVVMPNPLVGAVLVTRLSHACYPRILETRLSLAAQHISTSFNACNTYL